MSVLQCWPGWSVRESGERVCRLRTKRCGCVSGRALGEQLVPVVVAFERLGAGFLCVGCIRMVQVMRFILVLERLTRLGRLLEKPVGRVVGEA